MTPRSGKELDEPKKIKDDEKLVDKKKMEAKEKMEAEIGKEGVELNNKEKNKKNLMKLFWEE